MSERVNPHPYRIQLDRVHHELAEALDRVEGREARPNHHHDSGAR